MATASPTRWSPRRRSADCWTCSSEGPAHPAAVGPFTHRRPLGPVRQPVESSCEIEAAEETLGGLVVSGGEGAPSREPGREVLDAVAAPVGLGVVSGRVAVGWLGWHHRLGAGCPDGRSPTLRRVAAVAHHAPRPANRRDLRDQVRRCSEFRGLAGDHGEGARRPKRSHAVHALEPQPPRERPRACRHPPFGARRLVLGAHAGAVQKDLAEVRSPALRVEQLAEAAAMSVSSFHEHFRAITSLTPLQFQKQLRLFEARRMMLTDGAMVSNATYEVGYESISQFTR
nr:AraC family transcriptional regulator [Arenibaculum pallidiluteum]